MNKEEALKCADDNNLWSINRFINKPPAMNEEDKLTHMREVRNIIHVTMWYDKDKTKHGCLAELEEFIKREILQLS